ncbi:hypothetical protein [Mucilaginibacter sp. KACC 22063]|uniref:hypothetical protein n=1 Tax=Mucilaginibacter sp. KACC 22063 TaxID=3025666 RepID=UPI002366A198|nr:hypothetical protein [Mucilaginibacter sp. KACC 22063]WDF55800.1 hypothetical protein PQ461_01835 [Mucilaginibacter sp. KACC 22063]
MHQWQAPDVSGLPFPQNVSAILEKLSAQRFDGASVMLLQDLGYPARLATVKTYNTGHCLYYIPVRPFWQMKNEPSKQACFELTRTLFAYLYQIAGVPYFREPGYLDNTYDSLENWISEVDDNGNEDEEEEIFRKRQFAEFELLKQAGDLLLPDIKKPLDLALWENQLQTFAATDKHGKDLREVAYEFLKLVKDYPSRAIKESMHYELYEGEENYQIYWENYISFYWSGRDALESMLYDMVNNEFQEAGYQEEPIAVQWFDSPQDVPRHDFDFENRLFFLLDELTGILNELDHEEPNR